MAKKELQPSLNTSHIPSGKSWIGYNLSRMKSQRQLMWMSFPFIAFIAIFAYGPLWGWLMAFQNYRPGLGLMEQEWVGLDHFRTLFTDPTFYVSFATHWR